MLHPRAPFIVDPAVCAQLSTAALRANLEEHAVFNPELRVGGEHAEMAERLERILTLRESDLAVRELVWRTLERAAGGDHDGKDM